MALSRLLKITRKKDLKLKRKVFMDHMVYKLSFILLMIVFALFVLVGSIYRVIKRDGERYEKIALSQQTYVSSAIPYKRGEIQDRNGTVFARSETVYDLIISPLDILSVEEDKNKKKVQKYKEAALTALEEYFNVDRKEVETILEEKPKAQYICLQKEMEAEKVETYQQRVEEEKKALEERNKKKPKEKRETYLDLGNCIYFEMKYKRVYPLKTTASNIVGFATENTTYGIENYYNEELSGTTGRNYGYFNSYGELEHTVKPAEDGYTIVTTIDANVQQRVEKAINKFQNGNIGAEWVAVALANPQNGEIYAMASSNNSYDLNDPFNLDNYYTKQEIKRLNNNSEEKVEALSRMWSNYCVSYAYEPGSTFKPYTVSAVLEESKATDKSTYYCDGGQVFTGWPKPVRCTHEHGQITLAQTIMFSCNDALMQMGAKLGANTLYHYERLFGLGQRTGIDLPAEGTGALVTAERMAPVDVGVCSFGQSNTVTMMQMIAGFSSIINGGNYYVPHIMKRIADSHGAVVKTYPNEVVRKTVSEKTSKMVTKYLLQTVTDDSATAKGARVKGYQIGGKTGTAEKQPRDQGNYLLSFIGYVGYEEPELVIYVIIDEPHVEDQAHSGFATEFAAKILKEVLPFLGIYKESDASPIVQNSQEDSSKEEETSQEEPSQGEEDPQEEPSSEGDLQ